jgi:hypothetical protein
MEFANMTEYLHHVPGRLRVRAKAFRCDNAARGATLRKLRTLEGVRTVRLNAKAGSVTVCYDVGKTHSQAILDFMEQECLRALAVVEPRPRRAAPKAATSNKLTTEIGRMALSVLVNKGVSYSLSSLLGART